MNRKIQFQKLDYYTFMELAKQADAVYKINNCKLVNVKKVDEYIAENCKVEWDEFGNEIS